MIERRGAAAQGASGSARRTGWTLRVRGLYLVELTASQRLRDVAVIRNSGSVVHLAIGLTRRSTFGDTFSAAAESGAWVCIVRKRCPALCFGLCRRWRRATSDVLSLSSSTSTYSVGPQMPGRACMRHRERYGTLLGSSRRGLARANTFEEKC